MRIRLLVPILLSGYFFSGCDKAEPIPAYLKIEPFTVTDTGGAAWHNLPDVWVYVNGELLGAYTLPAEVPVLQAGKVEVQLFPGVKVNGIAATPNIYPFLRRYSDSLVLTPGTTTLVKPAVGYNTTAKTPDMWSREDGSFDSPTPLQIIKQDGNANNAFSITTDGALAGSCLLLPVDTAHSIIEVATQFAKLPNTGGEQVWLELHHANDVAFDFLIQGKTGGNQEETLSVFRFNATENGAWNKIYFNLTDYVVQIKESDYRLFFRVSLPVKSDGSYERIQGAVRLDNIRLLHF